MSDWRKPCSSTATWQKPQSLCDKTRAPPAATARTGASANMHWRFPFDRWVGGGGGADWRHPCGRGGGSVGKRMVEQRRRRSRSRRRKVAATVDLHPLASCAHPSRIPDHKLTQYAKNGVDTDRIKHLLWTGRCSCKRACFGRVRVTAVEQVCKFYWRLPPEDQAYLVPHIAPLRHA
jgi:hypothetical protein